MHSLNKIKKLKSQKFQEMKKGSATPYGDSVLETGIQLVWLCCLCLCKFYAAESRKMAESHLCDLVGAQGSPPNSVNLPEISAGHSKGNDRTETD